jgi:hypothetical protein
MPVKRIASILSALCVVFAATSIGAACDPCLEQRSSISELDQCPAHCQESCEPIPVSDQTCDDARRACLAKKAAYNVLPCAAGICSDPQDCMNIPDFLGLPGDPAPGEQAFIEDQDCQARCWECQDEIEGPQPGCQCQE